MATRRALRFTLEISTTLAEGDEPGPSMRFVGDWLNDNGYDYAVVEEHWHNCQDEPGTEP